MNVFALVALALTVTSLMATPTPDVLLSEEADVMDMDDISSDLINQSLLVTPDPDVPPSEGDDVTEGENGVDETTTIIQLQSTTQSQPTDQSQPTNESVLVNQTQSNNQSEPSVNDQNHAPECHERDVSSWHYQPHEEPITNKTVVSFELMEEHTETSHCIKNETFGMTSSSVWVTRGCRGTFRVCVVQPETFESKLKKHLGRNVSELISEELTKQRLEFENKLTQQEEEFENQLTQQEEQNMQNVKQIEALNKKLENQQNTDDNLIKQNQDVNRKLIQQDQKFAQQSQDYNRKISQQSQDYNKKIAQQSQDYNRKFTQKQQQINTLMGRDAKLQQCIVKNVRFYARHANGHFKYAHGQRVRYTTVWANTGNGYDKSQSIFRAPVSGMYVFNLHVRSWKGKYAGLALHNDGGGYYVAAQAWPGGKEHQYSGSRTLHLNKNDWVQIKSWGASELGNWGVPKNIFGGYLLHPDRCL